MNIVSFFQDMPTLTIERNRRMAGGKSFDLKPYDFIQIFGYILSKSSPFQLSTGHFFKKKKLTIIRKKQRFAYTSQIQGTEEMAIAKSFKLTTHAYAVDDVDAFAVAHDGDVGDAAVVDDCNHPQMRQPARFGVRCRFPGHWHQWCGCLRASALLVVSGGERLQMQMRPVQPHEGQALLQPVLSGQPQLALQPQEQRPSAAAPVGTPTGKKIWLVLFLEDNMNFHGVSCFSQKATLCVHKRQKKCPFYYNRDMKPGGGGSVLQPHRKEQKKQP